MMKRACAVGAVVVLILVAYLLHSPIKDFLWAHPWWHSFLVAVPAFILGYLEWRGSNEANTLRSQANDLQRDANRLQSELDAERNNTLLLIAKHTQRPVTVAEKNAAKLRDHLRRSVPVREKDNQCGFLEIVEVNEDNMLTLFKPRDYSSSSAYYIQINCGDLEIVGLPPGRPSPLSLTILKRHGVAVDLGDITKWEDRSQVGSNPPFPKGGPAFYATYTKPGSAETRTMHVYTHKGGENSFLLESSTGAPFRGNNEEVSKQFLVRQVEYQVAGFRRTNSGNPGGGKYPLFIC
jgi:hypothetical protein